MEEPRDRAQAEKEYLVLNPSFAGLYDEMVAVFAGWPGFEVVVGRRGARRAEVPGEDDLPGSGERAGGP